MPHKRQRVVRYPAPDDRATERFVTLQSGLRVRVVECGASSDPPVLLLGGWATSAFTFRHQLPYLADGGFRAIAPDLKGHGFSDKPRAEGEYTCEAMVAHVEELIDTLAGGSASIVAQSMAGPLAVHLARRRRRAIPSLVLISPVGLGVTRFARLTRWIAGQWLDPIVPYLAIRPIMHLGLGIAFGTWRRVTAETIDGYLAPAASPAFARALRALARRFCWAPLPDEAFLDVADRTLVILGSKDRLVRGGPARAERIFGGRALVLAGVGHAANEEDPQAVNAAILGFLRRDGVTPAG